MAPPTPPTPNDWANEAERFACFSARLLADSKCENVSVLNVQSLSQVTDFIVIASANSERQIRSMVEDIKLLARTESYGIFRSDGVTDSQWAVVDLLDVMAHVMTPQQRAYYDLESMWGDGKRVDWFNRTNPGQFAKLRARVAG